MVDGGHSAGRAAPLPLILCVDDDPANRKLLERIISRRSDLRFAIAADASEALEIAKAQRPDILLLDRNLPDMSGDEVLDLLRADPNTSDLPVVFVSGDALPDNIERALAAGADGYLTKPFAVQDLFNIIDRLLAECGPESAGPRHI